MALYKSLREYNETRSAAAKIPAWVVDANGRVYSPGNYSAARKEVLSGRAVRLATVDEMFEAEGL